MDKVEEQMQVVDRGLIFTNLVDFDAQYGHRKRRGRLRGQPRTFRRATRQAAPAAARRRPAGGHRRPRQRPPTPSTDHARRVRTAAGDRRPPCAAGCDLARERASPTLAQTLGQELFASHATTAPASVLHVVSASSLACRGRSQGARGAGRQQRYVLFSRDPWLRRRVVAVGRR